MTVYLLDTNIPSDVIRNPQGCAATKIAAVGEENVATSVVFAAELRFGTERRSSPRLTPHFEAVLRPLPILLLDGDADIRYGLIRADLERRGTPIGGNDMLIAAHALSLGAMLVTINMPELARVEMLSLENWLRDE